jgi:hypothetical protein
MKRLVSPAKWQLALHVAERALEAATDPKELAFLRFCQIGIVAQGLLRHCAQGGNQSIDTARGSEDAHSRRPHVTPPSVSDTAHDDVPAIDTN